MIAHQKTTLPTLAFALVLAWAVSACERPDTATASPTIAVEAHAQAIDALIRGLADATNARDFDAFANSITDDWTYFTSAGSEADLASFVEMITGWDALRIDVDEIRSSPSSDERLAWATFRGELAGEVAGAAAERSLRFTAILERPESTWRLRHLQSTIASRRF